MEVGPCAHTQRAETPQPHSSHGLSPTMPPCPSVQHQSSTALETAVTQLPCPKWRCPNGCAVPIPVAPVSVCHRCIPHSMIPTATPALAIGQHSFLSSQPWEECCGNATPQSPPSCTVQPLHLSWILHCTRGCPQWSIHCLLSAQICGFCCCKAGLGWIQSIRVGTAARGLLYPEEKPCSVLTQSQHEGRV